MTKAIVCILVAVFVGVGIYYFLNWIWDTYGQEHALTYAAMIIATIAAMAALGSLKITRDSLKLTRATARPFLDVAESVSCHTYTTSIGRIIANIYNKGIFPADEVSVNCKVRRIKANTEESLSLPAEDGKKYPSIYFPGDNIECRFEKAGIQMDRGDELRVHITISYRNKLTEETHRTVRAYSMTFSPVDRDELLSLYPKEDYWD